MTERDAPPPRFGPVRTLRDTPPTIWLITALFGLTLACWSVLAPQYHAADEPNHADAVMRLVEGQGWPHPGNVKVTPDGAAAILVSPFGAGGPRDTLTNGPIPASQAPPRDERPAWRDLAPANGPLGEVQQIVQHPPLYYWTSALVLKALPGAGGDLRWDVTIGLLRLISALLITPLPLLVHATARALGLGRRAATVAALFPLAVPQLTHVGSVVSNDGMLTLWGALVTLTVAHILRGDTSVRTAIWTGLFLGAGLLTKSLAIALIPLVGAAYLVGWRRARSAARAADAAWAPPPPEDRPGADPASADTAPFLLGATYPSAATGRARRAGAGFPIVALAVAAVLTIAAGGWWWVVNVVRWHAFQPDTPGFPPGKKISGWSEFSKYVYHGTVGRFWGAFGWFEVNLPWNLTLSLTIAVGVLCVLGLVRAPGRGARLDRALFISPTVILFLLMTDQAANHFRDTGYITGIAGRYLFAGLPALAVVIGAGTEAFGRRVARWAPAVVLVGAAVLQLYSARLALRHFWMPRGGGIHQAWASMSLWSPWPPEALWAAGVLTLLVALACGVGVLLPSRRNPAGPPPRPGASGPGGAPSPSGPTGWLEPDDSPLTQPVPLTQPGSFIPPTSYLRASGFPSPTCRPPRPGAPPILPVASAGWPAGRAATVWCPWRAGPAAASTA